MTPLQILKLVYVAHGYSLALRCKPLIHNEVQTWRYGPIIYDLYHSVKNYQDDPVNKLNDEPFKPLDDDSKQLVEAVYDAYKDFDGAQLSSLTHKEGSPWDQVFEKKRSFTPIPNNIIKKYYDNLVEEQ